MGSQVLALYWTSSQKRTAVTMQRLLAQNTEHRDSVWLQEEQISPLQSHQNTPQVPNSTITTFGSLALVELQFPQLFLQLPELQHHSQKIILVILWPWHMCTIFYLAIASFLNINSGTHLIHPTEHLHCRFLPFQDYHIWGITLPTSCLPNLQDTHCLALDLQAPPAAPSTFYLPFYLISSAYTLYF